MDNMMPPNGPVIGRYEIRRLRRKIRPYTAYNLERDAYVTRDRGEWGVASFEAAVRCVCRWQNLPMPEDLETLRAQLPQSS